MELTGPATRGAGAVVAALGVVVIVGWLADIPRLVQVHPSLVPMQFNTALCFVLVGVALARVATPGAAPAALLAALVGLITLAQYVAGVDLGIDELLVRHHITVATSHPGRMAPNTALCFVLAGVALSVRAAPARGVLAALIIALSVQAGIGYALQLEPAYGWGRLTRMAPHTAAGFALLGGSALHLAVARGRTEEKMMPGWLPPTAAGLLLAIVCGLSLSLEWRESELRHQAASAKAADGAVLVAGIIDPLIDALRRIGDRWRTRGGVPRAEWAADARAYLDDHAAYHAIERVSADGERWRADAVTREPLLAAERAEAAALLRAKKTGSPALAGPLEFDGAPGFLVFVPLTVDGEDDGHVTSVVRIGPVIDEYIERARAQGLALEFSAGERLLAGSAAGEDAAEHAFRVGGQSWRIRASARQAYHPGWLVLVIGSALALMTLLAFRSIGHMEGQNARLREEIEQREALQLALEHANEDLASFAHSVSHDLRAPLRHVDGFARLLERRLDASDATSRGHVQKILSAIARMQRLIEDLLGFSRTAQAELQKRAVDLDALVARVRSELVSDGEDPIEWRVGPLGTVEADRAMLEIVVVNLLSNAVKFSANEEHPAIDVSVERGDGVVRLAVEDNGAGFDPTYVGRLFQPFQRLHLREEYDGTGVGLAMVRRIIRRHDGDVTATGAPGEGARFVVQLPDGAAS